jgi:hypothetical protein
MSYEFQTQTNYHFIPSAAFAAIATPEEISLARVYPVVNSVDINKVFRKASDAKRFITAGFKLTFVTKTQFVIDDQSIGTIGESTIGPMVVIDHVEPMVAMQWATR